MRLSSLTAVAALLSADFAKLDGKEAARAFRSVDIARPQGPAAGRQRSYGATWA